VRIAQFDAHGGNPPFGYPASDGAVCNPDHLAQLRGGIQLLRQGVTPEGGIEEIRGLTATGTGD
jgi:hypothetical protein